jgi:hypothetical protein
MDKTGEMDMKIDYLLVVDQGSGVSWIERFAASNGEVARVAGGLISKAIRDGDIPAYITEADIYELTNRVRLNLVWVPEPEKSVEEANPGGEDHGPGQDAKPSEPEPEQKQEAQNG